MTAYPVVRYRDSHAAIDWLGRAFDFQPKEVHEDAEGKVAHAELGAGRGLVLLGAESGEAEERFGEHAGRGWVYVAVEDPDALHARAVAAGAEIVRELEDTDYGSRDFTARDPEGNVWSFGTYAPQPG